MTRVDSVVSVSVAPSLTFLALPCLAPLPEEAAPLRVGSRWGEGELDGLKVKLPNPSPEPDDGESWPAGDAASAGVPTAAAAAAAVEVALAEGNPVVAAEPNMNVPADGAGAPLATVVGDITPPKLTAGAVAPALRGGDARSPHSVVPELVVVALVGDGAPPKLNVGAAAAPALRAGDPIT